MISPSLLYHCTGPTQTHYYCPIFLLLYLSRSTSPLISSSDLLFLYLPFFVFFLPTNRFTRSDTYLALDTVLTGAQASADGSASGSVSIDAVALGALGRVDWLTAASASGAWQ